jgi:hypothetical protein
MSHRFNPFFCAECAGACQYDAAGKLTKADRCLVCLLPKKASIIVGRIGSGKVTQRVCGNRRCSNFKM